MICNSMGKVKRVENFKEFCERNGDGDVKGIKHLIPFLVPSSSLCLDYQQCFLSNRSAHVLFHILLGS